MRDFEPHNNAVKRKLHKLQSQLEKYLTMTDQSTLKLKHLNLSN